MLFKFYWFKGKMTAKSVIHPGAGNGNRTRD